jgi:MscS family membrane protein
MKKPSAALCLLLIFSSSLCLAQDQPKEKEASIREVRASQQAMEELIQEQATDGPLDMSTPLSSLLLLKAALDEEDYQRAGEFLDMRYLPPELDGMDAGELLQQLRYVWARQEILNIEKISDHPEGNLNDELPSYRDQIGEVELKDGPVSITMQRVPDGKGGNIWKISNATVGRIPEMWKELGYSTTVTFVRNVLPEFRWLGMENWQVLFLVLSFLLAWPIASLICILFAHFLVHRPGPFQDAITKFLTFQFRIFLFIVLVRIAAYNIGLTLHSKAIIQSSGVVYIALVILLLGVINLIHGYQARRLLLAGHPHYVAMLKPIATVIKVLVAIVVGLIWADDAGYDMSTIIAGLGVGSLAIALAAQKTLENVIGAITIYTARPIKPGDFCRFGTTVGTVEEVGLRSTMIRTLSRTLVSIPNAVFAADEVENYSERDRIRYFRYLRLEIGDAERLRELLSRLREIFEADDNVQKDTISVRFDEITDNTAHVRIDAGIMTDDFQIYLAVAEELNLQIIDTVQVLGARFSGPGQQLTVRQSTGGDAEILDAVERHLAAQMQNPAT